MTPRIVVLILYLTAMGVGCVDNRVPGNDRESALEPAQPAAEMTDVGDAMEGVSTGLLYPEVITDADRRTLPDSAGRCVFRYTRVGFPVFVFDDAAGVLKLNGRLIRLPASGEGRYSAGSASITFRPLEGDSDEGLYAAELVLRLERAPNEIGFHGYAECG